MARGMRCWPTWLVYLGEVGQVHHETELKRRGLMAWSRHASLCGVGAVGDCVVLCCLAACVVER